MTPEAYWRDEHAVFYAGDAKTVLQALPTTSVDCLVTSPPYYRLRDYGVPGQIGHEPTPDAYIDALRQVFTEAHRVLADDGTMWITIGDRYAANSDGWARGGDFNPRQPLIRPRSRLTVPPKNLLGMPWRLAFALQHDGWILRNAVVWAKPNAMPHPVRDRLTNRYELIFLLVKQRRYWFDLDAVRQPYTGDRSLPHRSRKGGTKPNTIATPWPPRGKYSDSEQPFGGRSPGAAMLPTGKRHDAGHPDGSNPGDVWTISTRPYQGAHFAVFPIDIPLRCIAAGCRPGGTVLDPFAGAATTALAARQHERKFIGIELNPAFCDLAITRLQRAFPSDSARGGDSD
ncbi:site-specific DNA-methyltransferase [Sphaerisporangium sp. TRM90804]|uniref:DNA-methyltransferase n=1 Tax=Sphaerisporangium sp. TRM90804 TaxID=3031113 RepID=UPI00244D74C0|nr:site-specific DNA-methyltransferase [Sphaerisporangium sp. TRM90804]MDH2426477.1 site-specific DNA-methyltransferase [Sphaerisporangium sp. TRM90804]